jgi:hypothetical protein
MNGRHISTFNELIAAIKIREEKDDRLLLAAASLITGL